MSNEEPKIKRGGSAFVGNSRMAKKPIPNLPNGEPTNVITLSRFCALNFISCYQGYQAIDRKLLIAFKMFGRWHVRPNPDCMEQLIEYLAIDQIVMESPSGDP